jgi:teichuronic acid biosynthesis glycosyltransferase TuaG
MSTKYCKSRPLISVVMTYFNSRETILDSIDSVKRQTWTDFELILVDNCSTDGTDQLVIEYLDGLGCAVFLKTEFNSGGPAVPRNMGVSAAKGEYVAFIDSDDIWYEDKLEIQIQYADEYDLIACEASATRDLIHVGECMFSVVKIDMKTLIYRNIIVHSSVMVKKELFLDVMYDEDHYMIGLEDYSAYMECVNRFDAVLLKGRPLLWYQDRMGSLGREINGQERFAKSMYCLARTCLRIGDYRYLSIGMFVRVVVWAKKLAMLFLSKVVGSFLNCVGRP